ncbi:hypothetical protein BDZ89DRAFT_364307 [Hymenopellis radicata]|nr:hypothetical protein BDZ89DRAFT_364307 [Hymenopellis radicata]
MSSIRVTSLEEIIAQTISWPTKVKRSVEINVSSILLLLRCSGYHLSLKGFLWTNAETHLGNNRQMCKTLAAGDIGLRLALSGNRTVCESGI